MVVPREQPLPGRKRDRALTRPAARPGFGRCQVLQVLMRPDVVIPTPKLNQSFMQTGSIHDVNPIQLPFQCAEESLDAAVLPRAMQIDALMPGAQQPQRELKSPGRETGFVVGTHDPGCVVTIDCIEQNAQQGDRCFGAQRRQRDTGAWTVIQDAKDRTLLSRQINLAVQVQAPYTMRGRRLILPPAQAGARQPDIGLMAFEHASNGRRADRHVPPVAAIEDHRKRADRERRVVGLVPDNPLAHPVGFAAVAPQPPGSTARFASESRFVATVQPVPQSLPEYVQHESQPFHWELPRKMQKRIIGARRPPR